MLDFRAAACAAAVAAAFIADPADAQEWSATVGGYMIAGIGYVDADAADAGAEIVNDAEVHVNYRLTADNGLQFGAKVEFEANGTSENADEYVGWVAGSFGRVEIGREDGAGDRLRLAPAGCNYSCAADGDGFLFDWAADEAGDAINNEGADSGDTLKITYFSPTFMGLRAGVSYVPGDDSASPRSFGQGDTSTDATNDDAAWEIGLRGDVDLGTVAGVGDAGLAASFSYFDVGGTGGDDVSYVFAVEASAGGFAASARWAHLEDGEEDNLSVGAGYAPADAPWTLGANAAFVLDSAARGEDDFALSVEGNYILAPGVTAFAVVEYADYDFGAGNPDGGFAVGAGLGFNF